MKINKLYTLIVVLVIAFLMAVPVSAQVNVPQSGYLWWPNDRRIQVVVIRDTKQELPLKSWSDAGVFPGGDLLTWINNGDACLAQPDSQYTLDPTVNNPTYQVPGQIGYNNSRDRKSVV